MASRERNHRIGMLCLPPEACSRFDKTNALFFLENIEQCFFSTSVFLSAKSVASERPTKLLPILSDGGSI